MDKKEEAQKISELKKTIDEQSKTIAELNAVIEDYKKKEQSISNAIIASMEHANQLEASRKKLYLLDIQRSRLMYMRMEQVINELYTKYPELKRDPKLSDMSEKFRSVLYADLSKEKNPLVFEKKVQPTSDDPIKKLLHNIIDCFDSKKPSKEMKVENFSQPSMEKTVPVNGSGFDLNEALHPTMELDEIMKVFNLGSKKKD